MLLSHIALPCITCGHVFMCWYRQHCWEWWRSSIIPNYISRSATCWLCGFWGFPMLALIFSATMGSWSRKCVRAYSNLGRYSHVEGERYVPMIGVFFTSVITLQLPMFIPRKRVASNLHPWGRSRTTMHTPPFVTSSSVVLIGKHSKLYPIMVQQ